MLVYFEIKFEIAVILVTRYLVFLNMIIYNRRYDRTFYHTFRLHLEQNEFTNFVLEKKSVYINVYFYYPSSQNDFISLTRC